MSIHKLRAASRPWLELCHFSDAKPPKPLTNVFNALVALRNDDEWKECLAYDQMLCAPVISDAETRWRKLGDDDIVYIQEWMQDAGLRRIARETVKDAVVTYCGENRFHPIRQWLDSLAWDGQKRLHIWLTTCLGCEPSDYVQAIGKMFLIAMVARIYQPGCKADYMLVLEGPQGKLKSTACETLVGAQYFSDDLPEINAGAKDAKVHLAGKWLVEVAELHAFGRAESTQLKSFLSRKVERYRPPYGRFEVDQPRQCVFIGTTNKDSYLHDETGGRRFWGVKCGHIAINHLRDSREQLFAEAADAWRAGINWWPDKTFEDQHIKPEQDARYEADAWEEKIKWFISDKNFVTSAQVATDGIGMKLEHVTKSVEMRIGGVLRNLNWVPERWGTERTRGFARPTLLTNLPT